MMRVDFGRYTPQDLKIYQKTPLNVRYLSGNVLKFSENYSFKRLWATSSELPNFTCL